MNKDEMIKKNKRVGNIHKNILFATAIILMIFAIGCCLYAGIKQIILSYERFGAIFAGGRVFIPDKSAWWFCGVGAILIAIPFYIKGAER